jgi:hypothetical protein
MMLFHLYFIGCKMKLENNNEFQVCKSLEGDCFYLFEILSLYSLGKVSARQNNTSVRIGSSQVQKILVTSPKSISSITTTPTKSI